MDPKAVLRNLGDIVKDRLTVSTVFGEPIKLESRTVIPVARVMVAGGGGYGKDVKKNSTGTRQESAPEEPIEDSGFGGGGVIKVQPIGFIYERDGEVIYSRIEDGGSLGGLPLLFNVMSRLRGRRKNK